MREWWRWCKGIKNMQKSQLGRYVVHKSCKRKPSAKTRVMSSGLSPGQTVTAAAAAPDWILFVQFKKSPTPGFKGVEKGERLTSGLCRDAVSHPLGVRARLRVESGSFVESLAGDEWAGWERLKKGGFPYGFSRWCEARISRVPVGEDRDDLWLLSCWYADGLPLRC